MQRAKTLKGTGDKLGRIIRYYTGLAEDQLRRDGLGRGPLDYYLDPDEPPGRWWGDGREAVGLDGDVQPEQLARMLEACHPGTGEKLGRGFGERSARAFDATFSAEKSVSVLWALSPDPWVRAEVLGAHDTAVDAALGWLQHHGGVTRRGTDGVHQVDAQGLVVALFRQHTSRSVDPQLHTHALVWSKVQDPTGKWLSLDARFLKQQQRSVGWVYDAALRSELTARLGVAWGPVAGGQADLLAVPNHLRTEFSQRSEQVDSKLTEYVKRWSDEHDGAEPERRTVAKLERYAARDSRPAKVKGSGPDHLRSDWSQRARKAGFDVESLSVSALRQFGAPSGFDREAVIVEALERVTAASSTWTPADLAREIATLVPAKEANSADDLVALVDELAAEAAGRCVELHPVPASGVAVRADGRPITEHVTDRLLSTSPVLGQERRLLDWARSAEAAPGGAPQTVADTSGLDKQQDEAVEAVAGAAELVLVVGPAGTGKTTTLAAAVDALHREQRPVLGVAPSGKAADVLAQQSGCHAVTLAKLLTEVTRQGTVVPPRGTTVLLDEAGMASTEDLDRLASLVRQQRWRLVCVGDPDQLPAVGRGGMFAHWCDTLPAVRLDEVRRFVEPWEGQASLLLRAGDRRGVDAYAGRRRIHGTRPALIFDREARHHQKLKARGCSVAISTTTAATARAINLAIQQAERHWHSRRSVRLADGTRAYAGDRIATRRNESRLVASDGGPVRNRQTWTVAAVGRDGTLTVEDAKRGRVSLPAGYVARSVELGWAVTGYGNQGVTVDHGICVVEPSTSRAGLYVGMTRGRLGNDAWVVDAEGTDDPAETLASIANRPTNAVTAHAQRDRLHGQVVTEPLGERQRMIERLDRLERRPPPSREPMGLA